MRRELQLYQSEYVQYKNEAVSLKHQQDTDVDYLSKELTTMKIKNDN